MRTRLGAAMDHIGGTAVLLLGSLLLFMLLWGVRISALLAGLALFVLCLILRERTRKKRLIQREKQLRSRIGGELKLEQWVIMQPRRAHVEAALLLSQVEKVELERSVDEGALCKLKDTGERLLVACVQLCGGEKLLARDVAALQRACLREQAVRCVFCGAGAVTAEGKAQADMQPRVTLISRDQMIALAGAACPATDEQLIELGKRKRRHLQGTKWRQLALQPERARRYLFYGLLLCFLYFLLGSIAYLVPGCLCLVLMALCRAGCNCKTSQKLL